MLVDYILESTFYKNLAQNDNFNIDHIPGQYIIHHNPSSYFIKNINDFMHKLDIFEYWMIKEYPDCYYQFIYDNYEIFSRNIFDELFDKYKINLEPIIYIFKYYIVFNELIDEFIIIGETKWLYWLMYNSHAINYFKSEKLSAKSFDLAINNGDPGVLQFIKDYSFTLLGHIAYTDNLQVIRWLLKNGGTNCITGTIACRNGNFEVLEYLLNHGWDLTTDENIIMTLLGGKLDVLKFILSIDKNKTVTFRRIMTYFPQALKSGNLELCKYLIENDGAIYDPIIALQNAVLSGNLDLIKWILDITNINANNCSNSCIMFYAAVLNGNLTNMKYLYELGFKLYLLVFDEIFKHNNMELVEWLISIKSPWDEYTFSKAILNNDLNLLKLIKTNGCKWDEKAFITAIRHKSNNIDILEWLMLEKCPLPLNNNIFGLGLESKNINKIRWLDKKGFLKVNDICVYEKIHGHDVVIYNNVKYLCEKR